MIKNLKTYRPRLSPAMVIALAALVVAMSVPAQAAMERIAKGTVGTAQLKTGAVTTPKLRYGAVTSPKIRNGTVSLGDLSAAARPKLPLWRGSDNGGSVDIPAGQWTTVLTLSLPAGQWLVSAKGVIDTYESMVTCDLVAAGQTWDRTFAAQYVTGDPAGHGYSPMSLEQRVVLSATGSVQIRCTASTSNQGVFDTKINAIRVRS